MRLDACREVVNALPQANYDLLRYLITFLNKVWWEGLMGGDYVTGENQSIRFGRKSNGWRYVRQEWWGESIEGSDWYGCVRWGEMCDEDGWM